MCLGVQGQEPRRCVGLGGLLIYHLRFGDRLFTIGDFRVMVKQVALPLRPRNDAFRISAEDKDCLTYYVLFGKPKQEAFARFHTEYIATPPLKLSRIGNEYCKQFFALATHTEYINAYRDTLEEAMYTGRTSSSDEGENDAETRKERALRKFTDKVYSKLEEVDSLDEMTDAATLGKTVKIFKEEEIVIEPPRRYLPETCNGCKYKQFIDEQLQNGNIVEDSDVEVRDETGEI